MTGSTDPARLKSPAAVSKLAFYEARTTDVDRLVEYYNDVLGLVPVERAGDTAYLTTGPDHHCVVVTAGEPNGRARTRLRDRRPRWRPAATACRRHRGERRSDPEPGIAAAS